jgi:subtilase family serine protease
MFEDGFNNPNTGGCISMAVFNKSLYVGTVNHSGREIWRFNGNEKNWENVSPPLGDYGINSMGYQTLGVHGNRLFYGDRLSPFGAGISATSTGKPEDWTGVNDRTYMGIGIESMLSAYGYFYVSTTDFEDGGRVLQKEPSGSEWQVADLALKPVTGPSKGIPGSTITIGDTTKNNGPGKAPESTTEFYWSTNTAWDWGDTYLGSRTVPALGVLQANTGTITATVPPACPGGTFYIIAKADFYNLITEPNETNNTRYRAIKTGPDLIVSRPVAPSISGAGKTIAVRVTTKNKGGCSAVASRTKLYLSTNTTYEATADIYLGSVAVPELGANDSSGLIRKNVTIPAGTVTKTVPYYIIAKADANNTNTKETNENNNIKYKPIKIGPNLIIVSPITAPASAVRGSTITIGATTKNTGGGNAVASTTRLYLSKNNTTLDSTDTYLGSVRVPRLIAGASSPGSISVRIHPGIRTGTYYIIALADYDNTVVETNETNNIRTRAITINRR